MTSMLAWLSFLSLLGPPPSTPPLVISGASECPGSTAVTSALSGLLPPRSDGDGPDVLHLQRDDDGLDVHLASAGGLLIGEKHLPGTGSCDEQAQTVAVLVAAWETQWRPGAPPALPRAAVIAAPPPGTPATTVAARPQPPPAALEVETRAGLLASIAGGTLAPAATCDVGLGARGSSLAVAAGALAVGGHDAAVGPGSVRWRRLGGTLDLRSRLSFPAFMLEMHAGAALTALSLSGQSLPRTTSATVFDPGMLVGLRARIPMGGLLPWFEATAAFWPTAHTAYIVGDSAQRDLPSFQVLLGGGLAFGPRPQAPPREE